MVKSLVIIMNWAKSRIVVLSVSPLPSRLNSSSVSQSLCRSDLIDAHWNRPATVVKSRWATVLIMGEGGAEEAVLFQFFVLKLHHCGLARR